MFEFEKKKKKKGKKRRNTGRFAPHEDANESGEGEGEVRPPPSFRASENFSTAPPVPPLVRFYTLDPPSRALLILEAISPT